MNKYIQGPHINTWTSSDKANISMKKLELWKRSIESNIFDTIPSFERCLPSNETEAIKEKFSSNACFAETVFIVL
jgi:hypothetical protein